MIPECLSRIQLDLDPERVHLDYSAARLVEEALARQEGVLAANGSLCLKTGDYTGRSPRDRFIVDTPDVHDRICWGHVNVPLPPESFDAVRDGVLEYLAARDVFVVRGLAGADRNHSRSFAVACERASQALFVHQMLVRPGERELARYGSDPDFIVLAAPGYECPEGIPGLNSRACVAIDFEQRLVVVAGTGYSGEIKKSVFSVMNYLLPVEDDVLPMHCSVNMDPVTRRTAVFFGLSGTGKTTLSADPSRLLIGDDEHGWSGDLVFNIEGGCYAKCAGLDPVHEPEIYDAVRFGAICENVAVDPQTRRVDFDDLSLTENTRCAYPVDHIANAKPDGRGPVPDTVIFLTADAFGVLPPISRLDADAAMYHFVTGFTAKTAGTEQGVVEPQPTFSALFGEPFMPLDPLVYARMLGDRLADGRTRTYLVNTGWTGGGYGTGHRIELAYTRAMVRAAVDGTIEESDFVHDDLFNLDVPRSVPGVPPNILDPAGCWASEPLYREAAQRLARMFAENFSRRYPDMPAQIRDAGPRAVKVPEPVPPVSISKARALPGLLARLERSGK